MATFTIYDPTGQLLGEIADTRITQRSVALTYRLAMIAEQHGETVDWPKINRAIMNRWSRSGLERVKKMAWAG